MKKIDRRLLEAMRTAVYDLEQEFKKNAFAADFRCDSCRETFFSPGDFFINYVLSFEDTAQLFIRSKEFSRLKPHDFDEDGPVMRFLPRDEAYKEDWRTFFFFNAELELLCLKCQMETSALKQN